MSKEESIKHFKLRRKRYDNKECSVCCEEKDLYEFDCGDCEHCFCIDCYKLLDKCSSCNIPKHPYYQNLFQEEYLPEVPTVQDRIGPYLVGTSNGWQVLSHTGCTGSTDMTGNNNLQGGQSAGSNLQGIHSIAIGYPIGTTFSTSTNLQGGHSSGSRQRNNSVFSSFANFMGL